jgi:hypothetical protein
MHQHLMKFLPILVRRAPAALQQMKDSSSGLANILSLARDFATLSARDVVSFRVLAVLGTDAEESQERLWPEMASKTTDKVVSDYSLGLMKFDRNNRGTVLLHSKVATSSLLRYVSYASNSSRRT